MRARGWIWKSLILFRKILVTEESRMAIFPVGGNGKASIREIQGTFPEPGRPIPRIQTTVYRLEAKDAVWRVKMISKLVANSTAATSSGKI